MDIPQICFNAHKTMAQDQRRGWQDIVMHLLLFFISSLVFKPLFLPIGANSRRKRPALVSLGLPIIMIMFTIYIAQISMCI